MRNNNKMFLGGIALLFLLAVQPAMAQSTLFNIPSTDVVSPAKLYGEFDFFAQMPTSDGASRFYIYVPRAVVGVGGGVEVGANVAATRAGGATQWYFQPNMKWRFAANDDKGLAGSAGVILYTPMNNRSVSNTFGLVYGNFSKKVKTGDYGPRFTIGPYGIVAGDDEDKGLSWSGPKGGVVLGYEQPIHSKVTIVADWFSGKNAFGYFTPGVSFTLPHTSLLNIGYSIGNDSFDGNNNRALFIYYGIVF